MGLRVVVDGVDRGAPVRDTASPAAAFNKRLTGVVREAIRRGKLPIVLAGSCVATQGALAGFDHAHRGAARIDAHGDFMTPEPTVGGFFPGRSPAVVTGHCYRTYWAQVSHATPLDESAVVMVGVRDCGRTESGSA